MVLKIDGVFGVQTRLRFKKFLTRNENALKAGTEKSLKGAGFGKGSIRALQRFLSQEDGLEPTKLSCTGEITPATITVGRRVVGACLSECTVRA